VAAASGPRRGSSSHRCDGIGSCSSASRLTYTTPAAAAAAAPVEASSGPADPPVNQTKYRNVAPTGSGGGWCVVALLGLHWSFAVSGLACLLPAIRGPSSSLREPSMHSRSDARVHCKLRKSHSYTASSGKVLQGNAMYQLSLLLLHQTHGAAAATVHGTRASREYRLDVSGTHCPGPTIPGSGLQQLGRSWQIQPRDAKCPA